MKTKLLSIILILLISCSTSFAQFYGSSISTLKPIAPAELIVYYDMWFVSDSTQIDKVMHEDVMLVLGNNISQYMSNSSFRLDSTLMSMQSFEEAQAFLLDRTRMIYPKFKYQIYKNYPQGKIAYYESIGFNNNIMYNEDLSLFTWDIKNDTTTIHGYKAQKATTSFGGRDWVAWFTTEIPYNDGPYKFSGLPGLIIDIRDTKSHYIFELQYTEIPKRDFYLTLKDKEFRSISKDKYMTIKKNIKKSNLNLAKQQIKDQKTLDKIKRRKEVQSNNPIELSDK